MIGETLGHYKILDLLGAGGMGEVYRAEDTTLDREVALKVLPTELSSDPDRLARFEREAKTLAALDHPNIVTIHTVEEAEGVRFLTMQLVEGRPLSEMIPKGGMPLEQIFEIAIPLADALATAHEKGVIHRDLKPANIMVTDEGRVKVLDFGLAKLFASTGSDVGAPLAGAREGASPSPTEAPTELLTEEGLILGTMPYMSPEQLEGKPLDARTDVFSLGVILYEMATGDRPFKGDSSISLIMSIGRDTPPEVDTVREELPHHLGRVIGHCLEKNPERRYHSLKDVRNELESLKDEVRTASATHPGEPISGPSTPKPSDKNRTTAGRKKWWWLGLIGPAIAVVVVLVFLPGRGGDAPGPEVASEPPLESEASATLASAANSIAVLPFADMSPDKDQEYFSDGISEELLNLLAKIPELRVTSRSSAFSFKGKDLEIPEIAQRLNVAHILEGSVRKAGNHVRITAQLIDASSDTHMWSETYDRTFDDIFALQDEIAADVVAQLKVTLLGAGSATGQAREMNAEAYNLVLQGKYFQDRRSEENLEKAAAFYEQALELDPEYPLAWARLAAVRGEQASWAFLPFADGYQAAREAAEKALELDENLPEAWVVLSEIRLAHDWDWPAADEAAQRALDLSPGDADILRHAAYLASTLGRLEEALALSQRAVELDPLGIKNYRSLAIRLRSVGRLDEAAAALEKGLELNPEQAMAHRSLGLIYLDRGEAEAALEEMERETFPEFRIQGLALAYHALGRQQEADETLATLIEVGGESMAYQIAQAHAYRGEVDAAFEWLERGYAMRDPGLIETGISPLFANIHADPRWLPFLKKIGLAD